MSSIKRFARESIARRASITAVEACQRNLSTHYEQLVARDSSSIHAGGRYTTNQIPINSSSSNISVNGPAILIDSDVIQSPGVRRLIEDLESTALRMEELRSAVRRLESSHTERSLNRGLKRRKRQPKDRMPSDEFTTRTSISFGLPAPGDHETVLTMKVRFTISYTQDSIFGFPSHWYEYDIVVANPTHRRLVSSQSGIGIANFGVDNEYFHSFKVCITLEDAWVWGDEHGFGSNTRAEVFQCQKGEQMIERDMSVRRRPLLAHQDRQYPRSRSRLGDVLNPLCPMFHARISDYDGAQKAPDRATDFLRSELIDEWWERSSHVSISCYLMSSRERTTQSRHCDKRDVCSGCRNSAVSLQSSGVPPEATVQRQGHCCNSSLTWSFRTPQVMH